jgi:hypothetical protein
LGRDVTDRPPPYHPHLWVPYPFVSADAEICTLCGEFLTPDNGAEDCPETFPEIEDDPPQTPAAPLDQPEPPDGSDDEQRRGAITPP